VVLREYCFLCLSIPAGVRLEFWTTFLSCDYCKFFTYWFAVDSVENFKTMQYTKVTVQLCEPSDYCNITVQFVIMLSFILLVKCNMGKRAVVSVNKNIVVWSCRDHFLAATEHVTPYGGGGGG
jgi:hypothetical protein